MANIRERNGRFAVQVRKKGFPSRTASFPTRRMAERWATTVEAEMIEGRHFKNAAARRRTVNDAIDKFIAEILPSSRYRSDPAKHIKRLDFWRAELGTVVLADLTADLIDEKLQKLLKTPYARSKRRGARLYPRSPKTVNRYAANLSRVLKTCRRPWRWMSTDPFKEIEKFPEPREAPDILDEKQYDALFAKLAAHPDPQLECICSVAVSTGPRASELLRLDWRDVDQDALADVKEAGVRVLLRVTKNAEPRVAWLFGRALELMRAHWERAGRAINGRVFQARGRVYAKAGRRRGGGAYGYHKPFKAACAAIGLPGYKFHNLRHCAATMLARGGASAQQLKAFGGWKSDVVNIYVHLAGNDVRSAVEAMNKKLVDRS